uniref:DUF2568 domain-containing protein n=1 Tax=Thermosporothrix sp. COM3 TaxID=2490863 RepID=A0A455SIR8_9CHLR|nr:hypothetical protein KTC_23670 [Thermosporothrix sp. COM3]
MISVLKQINLMLAFLLELALLVAVGYWGFTMAQTTLLKLVAGVGLALLMAIIWGCFEAPKAPWLLPEPWRFISKLVLFALGAGALFTAGQRGLGLLFALLALINLTLLVVWKQ